MSHRAEAQAMTRPMTALLLLLGLLAPTDVSAGRVYLPAPFELRPGATQGTAPRPVRIAAVHVGRGFCPDIAILSLRLPGKWARAYGYRLAVAAGRPPPGLETGEHLYSAPNGIVRLAWIDSQADLQRTFRFWLAVVTVDRAGRESQASMVEVVASAWWPPPYHPRPRPIPPMAWVAGFVCVFMSARGAGWLRRPRVDCG